MLPGWIEEGERVKGLEGEREMAWREGGGFANWLRGMVGNEEEDGGGKRESVV